MKATKIEVWPVLPFKSTKTPYKGPLTPPTAEDMEKCKHIFLKPQDALPLFKKTLMNTAWRTHANCNK